MKLSKPQMKALQTIAAGQAYTGPGSLKVQISLQQKGLLDGRFQLTDAGRAALVLVKSYHTKCPGSAQPVAVKLISDKAFAQCGCCGRTFPRIDMTKVGNVSPTHYRGTQTHK